MPRRFPIFQLPNRPLIAAWLAGVLAALSDNNDRLARISPLARLTSRVALLVWALEEVVSGANWFRRLLGVGGGGYALSRLIEQAGTRRGRASAQ